MSSAQWGLRFKHCLINFIFQKCFLHSLGKFCMLSEITHFMFIIWLIKPLHWPSLFLNFFVPWLHSKQTQNSTLHLAKSLILTTRVESHCVLCWKLFWISISYLMLHLLINSGLDNQGLKGFMPNDISRLHNLQIL